MINTEKKEKIILSIRRHWFVFLLETIGVGIAAILPVFLFPFLDQFFPSSGIEDFTLISLFFLFSWLLLMWLIFWVIFTNYYLDILIVTDRRVIDIEQVGLFARDITSAPLANVEDVKIEVTGIMPTLLKYGDLHIQTAASKKEIIMRSVRQPTHIKNFIMKLHDETILTQRNPN